MIVWYTADVRYSESAGGPVPTVAVIGAGASGTLAAICLLRAAAAERVPLRIALIDRWGQHGLGRAYATTDPAHLLNSPVGRMSAVADDPGHLARWAAANGFRPTDSCPGRPTAATCANCSPTPSGRQAQPPPSPG